MTITDYEVVARYPDVALDHDSKILYKGYLQRRLLIARCEDCHHYIHFPRRMCPRCWSERVSPSEVSGKGVVYFLCLYHQWPGMTLAPSEVHPAVSVELVEQQGLRFTSKLVDCPRDSMLIGLPVELDWQDWKGAPIPVFRPVGHAVQQQIRS